MNLLQGTLLQKGKYKIESILGQGGFGITYLGIQTGLNRQVAIKEFFMKEYCERDEFTSHVTLGSHGSRELVERFRKKFLKEAQTIANLKNSHIINIYDIFEENGTAYYVMEYLSGGSLKDLVIMEGALPEKDALIYVRQLADALAYIHNLKILHLDVKPSNVLLENCQTVVLIDFGISKRYDEEGSQTSSAPVGISKGFAPLEQYKQGGVNNFAPCTDIYSLGATFYFLLTGKNPPEASDVNDDGLPSLPVNVSSVTAYAIEKAMQPKRKDRPQSILEFLDLLKVQEDIQKEKEEDEDTIIFDNQESTQFKQPIGQKKSSTNTKEWKKWMLGIGAMLVFTIIGYLLFNGNSNAFLTDYSQLKIGDFYYSDGTFSHKRNDAKTCVGVVFSLQTTAEEQKHGWTHGQIVALEDAGNGKICVWGPEGELPAPHKEYGWSDIDAAFKDRNGYLYSHSGYTNEKSFEAFDVARSFSVSLPAGKTSGWYLPSIGQWGDILKNLGKVTLNGDSFDKKEAMRNLDFINIEKEWFYWSSTIVNNSSSWFMGFLTGYVSTYGRQGAGRVRPISAI